jgi:RNA polymerase sigma-70 factor (ECF subfamily)
MTFISSYAEPNTDGMNLFSVATSAVNASSLKPTPTTLDIDTPLPANAVEAAADQVLVQRAQGGDKQAFDLLVKKYQHRIIGLANRFVNHPDTALDVAQDCFIKAYRALPNFRGDSAFYTWLYRICINTAKNYLSSAKRRPPNSDILYDDAEGSGLNNALKNLDSPERLLIADEIQSAIDSVLEDIPKELRMALLLREVDELSYEDIALAMNCPIGTVRSRIFRAREAIEKRIAPLLEQ